MHEDELLALTWMNRMQSGQCTPLYVCRQEALWISATCLIFSPATYFPHLVILWKSNDDKESICSIDSLGHTKWKADSKQCMMECLSYIGGTLTSLQLSQGNNFCTCYKAFSRQIEPVIYSHLLTLHPQVNTRRLKKLHALVCRVEKSHHSEWLYAKCNS